MKALLFSFPILLLVFGAGCQSEENPLTEAEKAQFTRRGQDIVKEVSTVMTTALTTSLADGGVGKAASYCSHIAVPMVDTLAARHGISMRRTTTKVRNPQDAPTGRETVILNQFAQAQSEGKELQPLVELIDPHTVAYYQPIIMQPLCLTCHGKLGETMTEENYSFIKYLYPDDQAIGYELGELRGIWSLQLPREIIQ
jgi:hypothetical protein